MNRFAIFAFSLVVILQGCRISPSDKSMAPTETVSLTFEEQRARAEALRPALDGLLEKFAAREFQSAAGHKLQYRLFTPDNYDRLQSYPAILYLHGAGGRGDDNLKQISGGTIWGARIWALPENQSVRPCFIIAPQADAEFGWRGEGAAMARELVVDLMEEYNIDPWRIYVTGQSMGGGGTWTMISDFPEFFAAAVPICGRSDTAAAPEIVKNNVAVWAFHGALDPAVPVEGSREWIAALRAAGGSPRYTEYPDAPHQSWEGAYTEPELAPWLFAQSRPRPAKELETPVSVSPLTPQAMRMRGAAVVPRLEPLIDQFAAHTFNASDGVEMPYRLFTPKLTDASQRVPLVVFLHGSGGRGVDNLKQVAGGCLWGAGVWALPENQAARPCYVLAPQSNSTQSAWNAQWAARGIALIDKIIAEKQIDPDRVYVTGQSMGGKGTWRMLTTYGDRFAAGVPVCGRGDVSRAPQIVARGIGVWAFHGDADPANAVSGSRNFFAALRAAGGDPRYTEYPGAPHQSWEGAYTDPDLAPWLFAQSRQK